MNLLKVIIVTILLFSTPFGFARSTQDGVGESLLDRRDQFGTNAVLLNPVPVEQVMQIYGECKGIIPGTQHVLGIKLEVLVEGNQSPSEERVQAALASLIQGLCRKVSAGRLLNYLINPALDVSKFRPIEAQTFVVKIHEGEVTFPTELLRALAIKGLSGRIKQ